MSLLRLVASHHEMSSSKVSQTEVSHILALHQGCLSTHLQSLRKVRKVLLVVKDKSLKSWRSTNHVQVILFSASVKISLMSLNDVGYRTAIKHLLKSTPTSIKSHLCSNLVVGETCSLRSFDESTATGITPLGTSNPHDRWKQIRSRNFKRHYDDYIGLIFFRDFPILDTLGSGYHPTIPLKNFPVKMQKYIFWRNDSLIRFKQLVNWDGQKNSSWKCPQVHLVHPPRVPQQRREATSAHAPQSSWCQWH